MKKIGSAIRFLRKSNNLSQEQLASLVYCTREFISQIERDKRKLPQHLIVFFSNALNHDIDNLIGNLDKYKNFNHYLICYRLIDCMLVYDMEKIKFIIEQNKTVINELNYGDPRILKLYCSALIESNININLEASTKICLEILEINNIEEIKLFSPKIGQEKRYYSTILLLGTNMFYNKEYELYELLLKNILFFLEQNIFNNILPFSSIDPFFKRFYIMTLNNYADILFTSSNFNEALIICNKGINFSIAYDTTRIVFYLLKLKVEILYNLDNITESKETYILFKYQCILVDEVDYFYSSTNTFKPKYPKLFT